MRAIVVASVVGAVLVLCLSLSAGTQYCASTFQYHQALGAPLFKVSGTPVYSPWAWIGWARRFGVRAPRTFAVAEGMAFCGGLGAFLIMVALVARGRRRDKSTAHGSARWAERRELREAGLLDDAGVVLCQTADARFRSRSDG